MKFCYKQSKLAKTPSVKDLLSQDSVYYYNTVFLGIKKSKS